MFCRGVPDNWWAFYPPQKKNKVALTKTALLTILSTLTKSTFHQLVLKTRYEEAWSWPGLWYWGYLVMIFMYAPHCPRHAEDVWDHWVPFFDDSQTLPSMAFSFFRGILWVEHVWKVADSCSTNGWFNYHCLLCSWGSPYCVVLKKRLGGLLWRQHTDFAKLKCFYSLRSYFSASCVHKHMSVCLVSRRNTALQSICRSYFWNLRLHLMVFLICRIGSIQHWMCTPMATRRTVIRSKSGIQTLLLSPV